MAMLPFRDEDLNYFKFVTLVVNEFPKALRQTFKTIWDNSHGHRPGFQLWDDSTAVRNLFASTEGGSRTKVPVHQSFLEWDCTALFQATIYSRTFARHGTLNDVYVKPRGISHGHFHMSVVSTTGNHMETTALAIDQLRLLRNSVCHSTSSEMKRVTFDQYVKHAKGAFQALGISTDRIDAVDSLSESDFPTNEVSRLKHAIDEERRSYIALLESVNSSFDELAKNTADKEDVAMLSKKMNEVIRKVSGSRENLSDLSARKEDIPVSQPGSNSTDDDPSPSTAKAFYKLGIEETKKGNFKSARQYHKLALDIRIKLFGEKHQSTAACYYSLGITQRNLGEIESAVDSLQRALHIHNKLFGEHQRTADCYYELAKAHCKLNEFESALRNLKSALDIRIKLFTEKEKSTADCYYKLGKIYCKLREFESALQNLNRALEIRKKLFGKVDLSTADCYNALGVTEHQKGNFKKALQWRKRALKIHKKLSGEEDQCTAACYYALGKTYHELGHFKSALRYLKRASALNDKLLGEHELTANCYNALGITQHERNDFKSALQSHKRAYEILIKVYGEEHTSTTASLQEVNKTSHALKEGR